MGVTVDSAVATKRGRRRAVPNQTSDVGKHSAVLSVSAGITGLVSYACALLMAHLLPPAEFSYYAAGQILVGIAGIVSTALVPLPLAEIVRRYTRRSEGRRQGAAFASLMSLILGIVAGLIAGGITVGFAPVRVAGAVAVSSLVIFAVAPTLGWLQGELRFARYAVMSVSEVAVRLGFSVIAVAIGWGTAGALFGFAVGAFVLLIVPPALFHDLAWRPSVLAERARWAETGDIALTQLVVSALVGADVVVVAFLGEGSTAAAGFQALATLAKGPVYVAAGTVLVAFPLLRTPGAQVDRILKAALRSFGILALFAAAVLATAPPRLVLLVLPERYADSLPLLPWLALGGFGYAMVTVLATVLLALRVRWRSRIGLLTAAVVIVTGLILGWRAGDVVGLAVGTALSALVATVVLVCLAAPLLPRSITGTAITGLIAVALLITVLELAAATPVLWLAIVGPTAIGVLHQVNAGERKQRHRRDRLSLSRPARRR